MEASSHEHNLLKHFLLENYRVGSQLYAYSLLFEFEQFLSDIGKGINMASTIEGLLPERLLLNEQQNMAGAIYCMSRLQFQNGLAVFPSGGRYIYILITK